MVRRPFTYARSGFLLWLASSAILVMLLAVSCSDDKSVNGDSKPLPVTDIDGNVYRTVRIGAQVWMAENLRVTHYRNGEPIANVTDVSAWDTLSTGAYCEYGNYIDMAAIHGRLYNWRAVDSSAGIAPEGWHVPSDEEWMQLEKYLGMSDSMVNLTDWRGVDQGKTLKDTSFNGTNDFGFSAIAGGYLSVTGTFELLVTTAYIWSDTEQDEEYSWYRHFQYNRNNIKRWYALKGHGFSVRCVRD